MKKSIIMFIFILSMFLIFAIPACGKPYMEGDFLDQVDDQYVLTPGLELNGDIQITYLAASCDATLTLNKNLGLKGALVFEEHESGYLGLTLFGKLGPIYGEIGALMDNFSSGPAVHVGLNGFFPLIGSSGPNFESDFTFSIPSPNFPPTGSMGLVKGGWMWLFSEHSRLLIGGGCSYRTDYGETTISGPYLGLAEIVINDKIGPFLFDGKAQLALINGGGADASLSVAFMPIPWVGLGAEYNLSNSSVGIDLKVRI